MAKIRPTDRVVDVKVDAHTVDLQDLQNNRRLLKI